MAKSDTFREQHQKALEIIKSIQAVLTPAQLAADPEGAATIKTSPDLFIQETRRIISTLSGRIRREEAELYPLADKD